MGLTSFIGSRWFVLWMSLLLGLYVRNVQQKSRNGCTEILKDQVDFDEENLNKIAVVTGATGGLGLALVERFAELGVGKIYLTGRSLAGAQIQVEFLRQQLQQQQKHRHFIQLEAAELDLTSLQGVVDFAKHFSQLNSKLDILVNNGAVVHAPYKETLDGFESNVGVNHLSHYLLTRLLMPKLLNSTLPASSKIIHISSQSADSGKIVPAGWYFSPFGGEFSPKQHYSNSKLAQVLFSNELSIRLQENHQKVLRVTSNAVHPGMVLTGAGKGFLPESLHFLLDVSRPIFVATTILSDLNSGISTQVALSFSRKFQSVSGGFLHLCLPRNLQAKHYFDANVQELVWDASQFAVDPERKLLIGSGLRDVAPIEDWNLYVPPESKKDDYFKFDFESEFTKWRTQQRKPASSSSGMHTEFQQASCSTASMSTTSSSCGESECRDLIQAATRPMAEANTRIFADLQAQQDRCEAEKTTILAQAKASATSDDDDGDDDSDLRDVLDSVTSQLKDCQADLSGSQDRIKDQLAAGCESRLNECSKSCDKATAELAESVRLCQLEREKAGNTDGKCDQRVGECEDKCSEKVNDIEKTMVESIAVLKADVVNCAEKQQLVNEYAGKIKSLEDENLKLEDQWMFIKWRQSKQAENLALELDDAREEILSQVKRIRTLQKDLEKARQEARQELEQGLTAKTDELKQAISESRRIKSALTQCQKAMKQRELEFAEAQVKLEAEIRTTLENQADTKNERDQRERVEADAREQLKRAKVRVDELKVMEDDSSATVSFTVDLGNDNTRDTTRKEEVAVNVVNNHTVDRTETTRTEEVTADVASDNIVEMDDGSDGRLEQSTTPRESSEEEEAREGDGEEEIEEDTEENIEPSQDEEENSVIPQLEAEEEIQEL